MQLSANERQQAYVAYMHHISRNRISVTLTKHELRAAIDAFDDTLDTSEDDIPVKPPSDSEAVDTTVADWLDSKLEVVTGLIDEATKAKQFSKSAELAIARAFLAENARRKTDSVIDDSVKAELLRAEQAAVAKIQREELALIALFVGQARYARQEAK